MPASRRDSVVYARDDEDEREYLVVKNDEDQYSIWLAGRDLPNGWVSVGIQGPKQECIEYIDRHWTDLRPRSLREQMAKQSTVSPQ
jgi:MbtH protein